MKLVRAKLKQDFESVLRAQCCPDYLKHIKADKKYHEILTLDLDTFVKESIRCAYCNKSFGIVYGVLDTKNDYLVPLDLFDLDEGVLQ